MGLIANSFCSILKNEQNAFWNFKFRPLEPSRRYCKCIVNKLQNYCKMHFSRPFSLITRVLFISKTSTTAHFGKNLQSFRMRLA